MTTLYLLRKLSFFGRLDAPLYERPRMRGSGGTSWCPPLLDVTDYLPRHSTRQKLADLTQKEKGRIYRSQSLLHSDSFHKSIMFI